MTENKNLEETSVGAVVFRRNNEKIEYLLLFRAKSNYWEFPKGHIELKENEQDTLKRELSEECNITSFKVIEEFKHSFVITPKPNVRQKIINYLIELINYNDIKVSEEHSQFKWVSYEEAKQLFIFDNLKELIDKGHGFLLNTKK